MVYVYEVEDCDIYDANGNWKSSGFDYVAETSKTASNSFTGSTTPASELASDLRIFIEASRKLDRHKKVLFRKKTRAEVGFHPMYDIDPANPVPTVEEVFYTLRGVDHSELLHGIIGLATEAGEMAEVAYEQLINPYHDIDETNVKEEIGDCLWYLSRIVEYVGTTFLTEMKRNIAKLRLRHGESFDKEKDSNRDLASERKLLEEE